VHEYSAYIIGDDGHITGRIDLLCADEADAYRRAEQLVDGHTVELWRHDRLLATFVPPVPIHLRPPQ
jgi:hypothetical protein